MLPTAEAHYNEVFLGLKRKLPPNIHLLSLELYDENHALVRLEHCKLTVRSSNLELKKNTETFLFAFTVFEINEDQQYSRSKKINLEDLFVNYDVVDYKEMTLNAVAEKYTAESTRMKFDTTFNPYSNFANIFTSPEGRTRSGRRDRHSAQLLANHLDWSSLI